MRLYCNLASVVIHEKLTEIRTKKKCIQATQSQTVTVICAASVLQHLSRQDARSSDVSTLEPTPSVRELET